jgi:tRNA-specific 2-thiouridylase
MMQEPKAIKAVALLSGGLDSRLAIKVVQDQGIDVHAANYVTCFCTCTGKNSCKSEARNACEQLSVPLKVFTTTKEFMEVLKNPKHGYGKNMNPCIDCRILMFRKAKEYMDEIGASFLVTGEVLGQRPMSQRRDAMRLIDKEAGVEGLVLRPLCAKHLPMTVPEQEGWVDREKLLSISGRSRKEQMRLAESYDIRDYPCSAGGCLLTSEGFANKVRDLLAHKNADLNDMLLLKVGRHFRLPGGGKAVVGKDKQQNLQILNLARAGDIVFRPHDHLPAPTALLRDSDSEEDIVITADLCISHSKLRTEPFILIESHKYETPSEIRIIKAKAIPREQIDSLRI